MSFTDDDLADWKNVIKKDYARIDVEPEKLKALLARLEVAENCALTLGDILEHAGFKT